MSSTWPATPRSQLAPGVDPAALRPHGRSAPSTLTTKRNRIAEPNARRTIKRKAEDPKSRSIKSSKVQKRGDIPPNTRNSRVLPRKCRKIWESKCTSHNASVGASTSQRSGGPSRRERRMFTGARLMRLSGIRSDRPTHGHFDEEFSSTLTMKDSSNMLYVLQERFFQWKQKRPGQHWIDRGYARSILVR